MNGRSQIVPILFAGTELGSAVLISRIALLKNLLMDEKGDMVKFEKVYRQVILTMAEVVLDMITLIFQRIKGLVFNFPAGPTGLDQLSHVVFANRDVGHPAVVICRFFNYLQPVFKKVDLITQRDEAMSSDRICSGKSIPFLSIVIFFLISCGNTNPGNEKTASSEQDKLFGAITLGLPLGVLAAKYTPALPEDSRDTQRRLFYTPLLQSSVDDMNMTLLPLPNSLLQAGRGQSQFDKVKDYFAQIERSSEKYPQCLRYTVGLSLNSAWLILMFHEVEYAKDIDRFKQEFASRLDQFNVLIAAASMACEEEHKGFSDKLSYISKQSLLWPIQLTRKRDASEIVSDVVTIGKKIANYLNELSEVASGVPMTNVDSERDKSLVDRGNLKDAQGRTKNAIALCANDGETPTP